MSSWKIFLGISWKYVEVHFDLCKQGCQLLLQWLSTELPSMSDKLHLQKLTLAKWISDVYYRIPKEMVMNGRKHWKNSNFQLNVRVVAMLTWLSFLHWHITRYLTSACLHSATTFCRLLASFMALSLCKNSLILSCVYVRIISHSF